MSDRSTLAFIDLVNFLGLYTKGNSDILQPTQLKEAINCDLFEKFGAIAKPRGTVAKLSSRYTESGVIKPISWLGFYKAAGLNGQTDRDILLASGTVLSVLNADGTTTALTGTGKNITETRTSGLTHQSDMFDDFMLITNQDPDLIGNGDTLVKYDGLEIQRWGVESPGDDGAVEVESFDSSGAFTVSGGTAADEATTTQTGAATSFSKTSTGQAFVSLEKTYSAFSLNTVTANRGTINLFIARGDLPKLATSNSVQIFVSDDANFTEHYRFDFDIGQLREGWQLLPLDLSSPSTNDNVTIVGSPVTSAFINVRYRVNTLAASTIFSGWVWDQFLSLPQGAPTVADGTVAGTKVFSDGGTYKYKVTYETKYGQQSNAGPETPTFTVSSNREDLLLTDVPVSTDPQVVKRNIYRTVSTGSLFLFVGAINDNVTTTFTDDTDDVALVAVESPPTEGDLNDDNSPPPKGGIVKLWKRTIFIAGVPSSPQSFFFSEDNEPESFPTLNQIDLDSKITGIYESYSSLIVETEDGKWLVTNENPDFRNDKVITNIGSVGRRAVGQARIWGWAMDREGLKLYDGNNPVEISAPIRDKFDSFPKQFVELSQTVHSKDRNGVVAMIPDATGNFPGNGNNFVYQYWIDQEVEKGRWWQLELPSSVEVLHMAEVEDSDGEERLYACSAGGQVFELFNEDAKNWALDNGGTEAIRTRFQTKYMRLGQSGSENEGVTGRIAPRQIEVRLDEENSDPTSWTVTIETANGPDQTTATDTQTIVQPFATNESLLRYPVPAMQPGEYVKITLENTDASVSSIVLGVRLYYHVQPGQFVIETGDLGGGI